jgi:hypothetical protein
LARPSLSSTSLASASFDDQPRRQPHQITAPATALIALAKAQKKSVSAIGFN